MNLPAPDHVAAREARWKQEAAEAYATACTDLRAIEEALDELKGDDPEAVLEWSTRHMRVTRRRDAAKSKLEGLVA